MALKKVDSGYISKKLGKHREGVNNISGDLGPERYREKHKEI